MATFDPNTPEPIAAQPQKRGKSCLMMILIAAAVGFVLCAGICGGVFYLGVQTLKNAEPYQMALAEVRRSPEVIGRLGEPIEEASWVPVGQINVANGQGEAALDFDVKGPKAQAHVRTQARLIGGTWGLTQVEVTFADGERITLDTGGGAGDDDAPKWNPDAVGEEPAEPAAETPDSQAGKPSADSGEAPRIQMDIPGGVIPDGASQAAP